MLLFCVDRDCGQEVDTWVSNDTRPRILLWSNEAEDPGLRWSRQIEDLARPKILDVSRIRSRPSRNDPQWSCPDQESAAALGAGVNRIRLRGFFGGGRRSGGGGGGGKL